jgi:hypothetical protein
MDLPALKIKIIKFFSGALKKGSTAASDASDVLDKSLGETDETPREASHNAEVGHGPGHAEAEPKPKKDYSIFTDPNTPWVRKWYMFAFIYPTIISLVLEWIRRG